MGWVMKEIGGYIELDELNGKEYYRNAINLNSGRNCLRLLIRNKNIKRIYLPFFVCSVVEDVCKKEEVDVSYYSINELLEPVFSKSIGENEYIYIVNYYGQLSIDFIKKIVKKNKNIILDNAQAFFTKPYEGVDTIYTCRKYFGVADGAYLISNVEYCESQFRVYHVFDKISHVIGRYEFDGQRFYDKYIDNENEFDSVEDIVRMSKVSHNILKAENYKKIKKNREKNFKYLQKKFFEINKLKVTCPKGPYAYPLLVDNGIQIRKRLQENKIYIPQLWEKMCSGSDKDVIADNYSKNILPLPVDQRYTQEDMQYLYKAVMKLVL